jgi:hypothetical protein
MRALLGLVLCLVFAVSASAQTHVFGGVTQAAVDKLINEASYPVTLVDQSAMYLKYKAERTIVLTEAQVNDLVREAEAVGCPNKNARLACAAREQRLKLERTIAEARKLREEAGNKWEGESVADLEASARGCFEMRIVIRHLRIDLVDAPTIAVSGAGINVADVHLSTDVTVQLQSKLPQFVCDKPCPIIKCCWGHFHCNDWVPVLTVTLNDVNTTTSAVIDLATSGAKVLGTPRLTKFTINVPILGDVDITGLVNLFLKPKQTTIYDAGELVASIPILNTTYKIQSLVLTGTNELRVDVLLQKR